jgi:hypothetical protein
MARRYVADLTQIWKAEAAARLTPEDFKNIALGVLSPEGLGRLLSADFRRASEWQQSLYAAGHCPHAKRELVVGQPASVTCSGVCPFEDAKGLPSFNAACHLMLKAI